MPYRQLLSLGRVLAITSTLFLADHSPPYDCLPLRGTSAKSDSISHPYDTAVIRKFQILPGIAANRNHHSFLENESSLSSFHLTHKI